MLTNGLSGHNAKWMSRGLQNHHIAIALCVDVRMCIYAYTFGFEKESTEEE